MKRVITICALVLLCTVFGCAKKNIIKEPTSITLHFTAEKYINDDVLLPIDIILVKGSVIDAILDIGPEQWFGHIQRESLEKNERISLAMSGGEERIKRIELTPGFTRMIVFADYEGNTEREGQQLIIPQGKLKKEYRIKIKERALEIE